MISASRVGVTFYEPPVRGKGSYDPVFHSGKDKWFIVSDPIPPDEGGYRPGAAFTKIDMSHGLRYGSFTPGTCVESVAGKRYEIRRREAKLWLWSLERDKWALRSEF